MVLTLPAEARRRSLWTRYTRAGELWRNSLRHRLARRYGRVEYVQTWEAHRDGTPHVNLVLGGEQLLADVDELGDGPERRHPYLDRPVRVPRWRSWWLSQAQECGFGRVGWVERLWTGDRGRDARDGLAAYMVKLAHGLGVEGAERSGELARELVYAGAKDQTPLSAPRNFRRLRTSQGLLPPRWRGGDWTGALRPAAEDGWTWARVSSHVAKQAGAIELARERLMGLADRGLPVPPEIARLAARERPEDPRRVVREG